MANDSKYPREELLLEPSALVKPEAAGSFTILDARPRPQFDQSRIPGAIGVDAAGWAKAFGKGEDAEGWSARIGGLGIGREAKVVVYDNDSFKDAARIWWILKFWGVEDARLLNGNWIGWSKSGLPIKTDKPKSPSPAKFTAVSHPNRLATKGQVLGFLKEEALEAAPKRERTVRTRSLPCRFDIRDKRDAFSTIS